MDGKLLEATAGHYCDLHGLTDPMLRKWVKNLIRKLAERRLNAHG